MRKIQTTRRKIEIENNNKIRQQLDGQRLKTTEKVAVVKGLTVTSSESDLGKAAIRHVPLLWIGISRTQFSADTSSY